jgi:hypothetical protein
MARFSFALYDQSTDTLLAGETVLIKSVGGTALASTSGTPILITDNGDGTYYVDDMPVNQITVYVGTAQVAQPELTNIPWDNGASVTHPVLTAAHGSTGAVIGQGNVDGSTIEYSSGLRVKDAGIVAAKIGTGAVIEAKVGSGAVTASKIGTGAVTADKIGTDAVTGIKINAGALGGGLEKSDPNTVSINLDANDMEFNGSNELALIKSLSSQVYITEGMTLMQMLSVLDNRMRQNSELVSSGGNGGYYQILYTLYNEDLSPNTSMTSPSFVCTSTVYADGLVMPLMKTPEMRQLVFYYKASVSNVLGDGYVTLKAGGLSSESAVIDNTTPQNLALYLDITSLSNFDSIEIQIEFKCSGGYTLTATQAMVVARSEITAVAGETSYEQPNPVV